MIFLDGMKVALLAAAVARIAAIETHKAPTTDDNVAQIVKQIGGVFYNIYDEGVRGYKKRYLRIDFENDSIVIEVGPQPELVIEDPRPEGDGPSPGTPVAMAA